MESKLYELVASAAIGGLITGIIVPTLGEWLRGFFNGHHAAKKRKKDKEHIVDFIREHTSYDDPASDPGTEFIRSKLFPRRKFGAVYELLMELNREGRIRLVTIHDRTTEYEVWCYNSNSKSIQPE